MTKTRWRSRFVVAPVVLFAFASSTWAQQFVRQNFEGKEPLLRLGLTDGQVRLLEHGLATTQVHEGKQAERMLLRIAGAKFCHVEFPVAPALVFEEVSISAWVFANVGGPRLVARVVLPKEIDDVTRQPMVVLLRGDAYEVANHWRRLGVRRPDLILQQQQQLLQAQRKRKIETAGAYIDAIILDVAATNGDVEIFIDDVQMGPIVAGKPAAANADADTPVSIPSNQPAMPTPAQIPTVRSAEDKSKAAVVADRLEIGGRPFFMRGVHWTEAPPPLLRQAGFNTVFVDWPAPKSFFDQMQRLGIQTVPMLPFVGPSNSPTRFASAEHIDFDFEEPAPFLHLGSDLDAAGEQALSAALESIKIKDSRASRPVTGDVLDGYRQYSRRLDMIGVRRDPIMTTLTPDAYRKWLSQRRDLVRPGTMIWNWIQTEPADSASRLVYGHGFKETYKTPVGPQPEQIALLAYNSIAAGSRGIVFSSDRAMAQATHGRDRALGIALLNLELTLIETFIAAGQTPILVPTSHPDVAAAVIRHPRGVLVLAFWTRDDAHYVVGQAAINDLQILIENCPEAARAFQLSVGDVRGLKPRRQGRIEIPEFDTAAMVIVTTDLELYVRYQELVQQIRPQASAWELELADIQIKRTGEVLARVERQGGADREIHDLLHKAHESFGRAKEAADAGDHRNAVAESVRARRFVRTAQHQLWLKGVKGLAAPVSIPHAVSFYTLPELYEFRSKLSQIKFGANQIPSGDFEQNGNLDAVGWNYRVYAPKEVETAAMLVSVRPKEGKRSLQLSSKASGEVNPVAAAENLRVEMSSPSVSVRPGQIVKISGFVRISRGLAGSVDGALIWDSLGGQALGLRITNTAGDWRPFQLFRPVQTAGDLKVYLSSTGIGSVEFDDLAVEIAEGLPDEIAGPHARGSRR